ncbi:MAG TPA: hypothetical protein DCZ43_10035, partial [candidate division Zixibacteria bacterium]|nr:hypothetical protein [candidate division Zixibacteria bacterium]
GQYSVKQLRVTNICDRNIFIAGDPRGPRIFLLFFIDQDPLRFTSRRRGLGFLNLCDKIYYYTMLLLLIICRGTILSAVADYCARFY